MWLYDRMEESSRGVCRENSVRATEGVVSNYFFFLDTQVFDQNAYDFENKHFKLIIGLVELELVRLVMTEVTRQEIEAHIAAKAKDAFVALDKFRRHGFHKNLRVPPFDAIAKGTTEDAIRTELLGQFREFCEKANVLQLSLEGVDIKSVLDDYFDRKPPFGEGKKKNEFPDAITAKILLKWCHEKTQRIVVVSGDGDWGGVTDPQLEVVKDVANYLARFPDPNIAKTVRQAVQNSGYLLKAVKREFENLDFYDEEYDAELTDLEVEDVSFVDFYVIDVKNGTATLEANVDISFSVHVAGQNHRLHYYDDDRDDFVRGTVSTSKSGTVTLEVYYEEDDPSDIDFAEVSLSGISPYVNVSSIFE